LQGEILISLENCDRHVYLIILLPSEFCLLSFAHDIERFSFYFAKERFSSNRPSFFLFPNSSTLFVLVPLTKFSAFRTKKMFKQVLLLLLFLASGMTLSVSESQSLSLMPHAAESFNVSYIQVLLTIASHQPFCCHSLSLFQNFLVLF